MVYILEQPCITGVSRVCKPVPISATSNNITQSKDVHVDIVCTLNKNPVWFVVSDRNPKYISWDDSHGSKGLKTRIAQVLSVAESSPILQPSSIIVFFTSGIEKSVEDKLMREFGFSEFELKMEEGLDTDSVITEELEDEWVNVHSRSYKKACILTVKKVCSIICRLAGVMEHVCTFPSNIVHQVVELGLQLLECSQDQAWKNAALFFAAVFVFRAILDVFDALDGLGRKLLSLLHEAASVRSGVNFATLTPSISGPRPNAEALTSSEKQIAYHMCCFVAILQSTTSFARRPNKSSRAAAMNIQSVRAAHKPLDISNEAMDAVFLQIQKDWKLGPALASSLPVMGIS